VCEGSSTPNNQHPTSNVQKREAEGERDKGELAFKPDFAEAAKRWEAYFAGEMIDRPVTCVVVRPEGKTWERTSSYRDNVFGDMDEIIDRQLQEAEHTVYGGEAIPTAWLSFGPDEIACFCGSSLEWSDQEGDTNWSVPIIEDWEDSLPIGIQEDHPLWQRMLAFYRRAAERLQGKMLLTNLDLHTNMDLLAALRGPERLCTDLVDMPDVIDRAMESAREVFPVVWNAIADTGRMWERGFCANAYAPDGSAVLQCDFSCMISPEMFRRWVLPALEEEARLVKHAVYHWDGPGALVHADDLIASEGLHTLSYVPGHGRGGHLDYLDLYQRVQKGGKAVEFCGSPDEIKKAHPVLRPEKTLYRTMAPSRAEAEGLLDWLAKHT